MKKVKFSVGTCYVGSDVSESIEFDDSATEEEIEEEFKAWVWENIESCWDYED